MKISDITFNGFEQFIAPKATSSGFGDDCGGTKQGLFQNWKAEFIEAWGDCEVIEVDQKPGEPRAELWLCLRTEKYYSNGGDKKYSIQCPELAKIREANRAKVAASFEHAEKYKRSKASGGVFTND